MMIARYIALAILSLAVLGGQAFAQSVCGDRAEIIKAIGNKYQEIPKAFGIAGQRILVELFTSTTGSWTMLMTQPHGITCILASGQSWEEFSLSKGEGL